MYCPRCGRPVSDKANFCGGCGLSRNEIIELLTPEQPVEPVQDVSEFAVYDDTDSSYDEVYAQTAENIMDEMTDNTQNEDIPQAEITENPDILQTDYTTQTPVYTTPSENVTAQSVKTPVKPVQSTYSYGNTKPSAEKEYPFDDIDIDIYLTDHPEVIHEFIEENSDDFLDLTTGDYLLMFLTAFIPVLGIIYLFYTAVASENYNKRNFARALLTLILFVIVAVVVYIFGIAASIVFGFVR